MDLTLFVEQASWLANGHLVDRSRFGVMAWVGQRLSPEVRARWTRAFPIHHPAQQRAERLLVDLLSTRFEQLATKTRLVETPHRSVDWTATYVRGAALAMRPPMPFVARVSHWVPDRALLGGLAAVGRAWLLAIEWAMEAGALDPDVTTIGLRERAQRLRSALAHNDRRDLPPATLDWRALERLRRSGETGMKLADAIDAAARFWGGAFNTSAGDVEVLQNLGASLREADVANADTLLELTTSLSIARAALQAATVLPKHWASEPWTLEPVRVETRKKYPALVLRSGNLRCAITKGTPPRAAPYEHEPHDDLVSPWLDEVLAAGEKRSTGHQPDIVLRFWHKDRPDRVLLALGDAKRNASGTGESYLRTSVNAAAVYMMAFSHALGVNIHTRRGEPPVIRTALHPGVTIFCRQRAGRTPESAVSLLGADPSGVPAVMAFDVASHFGPVTGEWSSPSLSAWFCCLARQARTALAS